jgi:thiol-disulfide isomerase/thioredoxin
MNKARAKGTKYISSLPVILMFFMHVPVHAQTSSAALEPGASGSDALPFLAEVLARYSHATSYHLGYTEEHHFESEFSGNWSKGIITAIASPAKHYRFEYRGEFGAGVQVSDGQTEWIYYGPLNQYIQQPTPTEGPSEISSRSAIGLGRLRQVHSHFKNFAHLREMVRTATFAPGQTVEVAGQSVPCTVIETEGEILNTKSPITVHFTFWIDKQTKVIRKSRQRSEGEVSAEPGARYVGFDDRLYQVAELDVPSSSASVFRFAPPASAILVREFEDKQAQEVGNLIGKPAPAVILRNSEGKELALQSLAGKWVLLDFWATWCVPCRESLPALEKLNQEYGPKGLVLLSVDQDDDSPQKATDFWTINKVSWPNFHAGAGVIDKFPAHGIPYFVLIDASGKITYSRAGLDEDRLRNAIAALDSSAHPLTTH